MGTRSIHEFDDVLTRNNINVDKLGCVMLPLEPIDLFGDGRDQLLDVEDLYASNNPERFWVNGDVSDNAHITLLYGLMTPAYEQKENVDGVLFSWVRPEYLVPQSFTFFPSPHKDERGFAAVVMEFDDPHIDEAFKRLSYLPHVNTHADYRQHMTVAYVKLESAQKWMDVLNEADIPLMRVKEGELDYGSPS